MGKIVYLIGKSSSGKDTIYKRLQLNKELSLTTIVLYTTRPIRIGEKEGVAYHFVDEDGYQSLKNQGKVLEERSYDTVQGLWRYFTVLEKETLNKDTNYMMIGTLESYEKTREKLGKDYLIPIFVDLDDGVRLQRALDREKKQEKPQYAEMCRRFLADEADFTPEKIKRAEIDRTFINDDLDRCLAEIEAYLLKELQ